MPEPTEPPPEQASGSKPQGRRRLSRALRRPARNQLVVGLLLGIVGFAGVTQVRTNEVDDSYSGLREQDLIDVLNGLAGTSQRAEAEIARLEQARAELRSDTSRREAALEQAQTEADNLDVLAGLVPVTGPGIRVTISEVDGTVELVSLLDTVQELRTVGAEAMQVNGQARIVAQSSFEKVEGGFDIDGTLVEPPYVIDVIGEPTVLSGALNFALGPAQQLREDGAELEITPLPSLDIEAVRPPAQPEYSEPDLPQ